jgi:hypothetical protein
MVSFVKIKPFDLMGTAYFLFKIILILLLIIASMKFAESSQDQSHYIFGCLGGAFYIAASIVLSGYRRTENMKINVLLNEGEKFSFSKSIDTYCMGYFPNFVTEKNMTLSIKQKSVSFFKKQAQSDGSPVYTLSKEEHAHFKKYMYTLLQRHYSKPEMKYIKKSNLNMPLFTTTPSAHDIFKVRANAF